LNEAKAFAMASVEYRNYYRDSQASIIKLCFPGNPKRKSFKIPLVFLHQKYNSRYQF
jgi:hypothetical protein